MKSETEDLLRVILQEKKFTKWRLSKEMGVSWHTIHFWSKGNFSPNQKHLDELKRIADEPAEAR